MSILRVCALLLAIVMATTTAQSAITATVTKTVLVNTNAADFSVIAAVTGQTIFVTAIDAQKVFHSAVGATAGLGRLLDLAVQVSEDVGAAAGDAAKKFKKAADDASSTAAALRCRAVKFATGVDCRVVYVGGALAGLGVLAFFVWPVVAPLLAVRSSAGSASRALFRR